jgi:protein-S-isoprenylcysteine O-methyltransferase Ste14
LYFDLNAKLKSKMFQNIKENKLITTGVYAYARNPVYSRALLRCTEVVLTVNNLLLLIVPFISWIYMTLFLKKTEKSLVKRNVSK